MREFALFIIDILLGGNDKYSNFSTQYGLEPHSRNHRLIENTFVFTFRTISIPSDKLEIN
jgi:hypothetical protein